MGGRLGWCGAKPEDWPTARQLLRLFSKVIAPLKKKWRKTTATTTTVREKKERNDGCSIDDRKFDVADWSSVYKDDLVLANAVSRSTNAT